MEYSKEGGKKRLDDSNDVLFTFIAIEKFLVCVGYVFWSFS